MIEEKKGINFSLKGVLMFVRLTLQNAGKGEIAIRDKEGKEISLDKLWGRYVSSTEIGGTWVNIDIELLDYDEGKKEILGREKDYLDEIFEDEEETMEEDAPKDMKIITKTERGTLFARPYSFIDRVGLGEKAIIGYYRISEFREPNGKGSASLSQILEEFIDRKVILTLREEDT